jgi:glucose-1-phosphate adenylyltransferase
VDVSNVVAVVLCGGRGSRLFPLTLGRAKPAVPIAGKYRLVDVAIANSLHSGIQSVFVLTQFQASSLGSHIAATYRFDSFSRSFVDVLAAEQTEESCDWYQGTADAVRKQLSRIRGTGAREVVILAGDHLYRMDLRALVARHRAARADATIAVTSVAAGDASRFGLVRADDDGIVREFSEKPNDPELIRRFSQKGENGCLASMGIYVFEVEALERWLRESPGTDFGQHVIPEAIARHRVAAFRFRGYWEDVGTIASYHRASLSLADPAPELDLAGEPPLFTRPRVLPPTRVDGARIHATILGEGSIVREGAALSRVVLGPLSVVGRDSVLANTIVLGSSAEGDRASPTASIGSRSRLVNAILDVDVRLGDDVVLENKAGYRHFDGPSLHVRDGIIVVPRGAVLPSGFVF